jgi:hypothetical protein
MSLSDIRLLLNFYLFFSSHVGELEPTRPSRSTEKLLHDSVLTWWRCSITCFGWKCFGNRSDVACLFQNLYLLDGRLTAVLLASDDYTIEGYGLNFGRLWDGPTRPEVLRFNTVQEAAAQLSGADVAVVSGLTLGVGGSSQTNFGHGAYDGFYPAAVSLMEFGLQNETINIYHNWEMGDDLQVIQMEKQFCTFDGGKFMYRDTMKQGKHKFESFLYGHGNQG